MSVGGSETVRDRKAIPWMATAALVLGLAAAAAPGSVRGEPNCTCRYAGQSFALTACVCIVMSGGGRVACCDKVLNNTSWTFTGAACPLAAAPQRTGPQTLAGRRRPPAPEGWRQANRRAAALAD